MVSRKIKDGLLPVSAHRGCGRKTVSKDAGFVDRGHIYIYLFPCGRTRSFAGATRAGSPSRTHVPLPPLWRSGGRSPGRAAGTEGPRASPPRPSRCGSTTLFWRWRHLLGEQFLSVEWFLIKKKKKVNNIPMTKRMCIHPLANGSVVWFRNKEHQKYEKMLGLMSGERPDTIYGNQSFGTCTSRQRSKRQQPPQLPSLGVKPVWGLLITAIYQTQRHLGTVLKNQGHFPAGSTPQIKA